MSGRRGRGAGGGGGHGGGGEERWLLPYSDMITLLLGLFIVLFAMSTINPHQFDNVRRSLSQTFHGDVLEGSGGTLDGSSGILDPNASAETTQAVIDSVNQAAQNSAKQFDREAESLKQLVKQSNAGNDVKVTSNEKGIKISLAGDALFASGSSQLNPAVIDKLGRIERELAKFHRPIEIAGHTDGQQFNGPTGNWKLSYERSYAVLAFFVTKGYPQPLMKAAAYADTQPVVTPPANDPYKAIAKNRRIEITVLAPGANDPLTAKGGAIRAAFPTRSAAADRAAGGGAKPTPVDEALANEFDDGIVTEIAQTSRGMG